MKRRALLVGVENYKDDAIQNLRYAIDDAILLQTTFAQPQYGFEVVCLRDPSQKEVLEMLGLCTKDLHAGDMFLYFFAGHGFCVGGNNRMFFPEDTKGDLIRGEESGLTYSKLKGRTEASVEGDQYDRVFLFDTCRSYLAGLRGVPVSSTLELDSGVTLSTRDLCPTNRCTKRMNGSVFLLQSCIAGQESLEIPNSALNGNKGNGLFTLALSNVLSNYIQDGQGIPLDDAFYERLTCEMADLGSGWSQTPEFTRTGKVLYLLPSQLADGGKDDDDGKKPVKKVKERPEKKQIMRKEQLKAFHTIMDVCQYLLAESAKRLAGRNHDDIRKELCELQGSIFALRNEDGYLESDMPEMIRILKRFAVWRKQHRKVRLNVERQSTIRAEAEKLRGTSFDMLAQTCLSCIN